MPKVKVEPNWDNDHRWKASIEIERNHSLVGYGPTEHRARLNLDAQLRRELKRREKAVYKLQELMAAM